MAQQIWDKEMNRLEQAEGREYNLRQTKKNNLRQFLNDFNTTTMREDLSYDM